MKDPVVQKQIESSIREGNQKQQVTGNFGMIINYNKEKHTANVMLGHQNSNQPGQTLSSIPCPHIPGIQYTAPEPGRMCWVEFRGRDQKTPVITHFFSPSFAGTDYESHNEAYIGVPKFLVDM